MEIKEKIKNSARWYYNLGLEKAGSDDLSGAIRNLNTALFFDKNDVDTRNLLGLVYFQRGQIVEALTQWVISSNLKKEDNLASNYLKETQANAVELDKMNQVIKKYNQALTYAKQGNEDLAMLQVKKVVSLMPNFIDAQLLMALLLLNEDKKEEAYDRLQEVLKIDRKNAIALDYMQEAKKPEEVKQVVEGAAPEKKKKEKKEAGGMVERFEKGLAGRGPLIYVIAGLLIGVIVSLALVYPTIKQSSKSKYESQIDDYKEQILAKDTQLKSNEKTVKDAKKAQSDAEAELREYVGDAKSEGIYDKLLTAMQAYTQKDYSTAALSVSQISRSKLATKKMKSVYDELKTNTYTPTAANNLYNKGFAAYTSGNYKDAVKYFKLSIKINDTKIAAYLYLGRTYEAYKKQDEAIKAYKTLIQKFPGTNSAKDSQTRIDAMQKKTTKKLN